MVDDVVPSNPSQPDPFCDVSDAFQHAVAAVAQMFVPKAQRPIYQKVVGHAVEILTDRGNQGSGVVINDTGLILTAAHVVNGCRTFEAFRWSIDTVQGTLMRNGQSLAAECKFIDREADFALLQLDSPPEDLRAATMIRPRHVPRLTPVYSLGFGTNKTPCGYYLGVDLIEGVRHFRFGAPASPGNSGGPAFDYDGHVFGIVNRKMSDETLPPSGYVLPLVEIARRLRRAKLPA